MRADAVSPTWRRISRAASEVMIEVMTCPPIESLICAKQTFDFDFDNPSDELVAAAERAQHLPLWRIRTLGLGEETVKLRFRDAVVTARCFDPLDLSPIEPLLDRGIGDP